MDEPQLAEEFITLCADGDSTAAINWLEDHPQALAHSGYGAHPLLKELVRQNGGHCHNKRHIAIAERLLPDAVKVFRDAILDDSAEPVEKLLRSDPELLSAEFTAGRGIAQPIHHWRSVEVGTVLVDAGANIEALTTLGDSPLAMQLRFGTLAAAKLLLRAGADPNRGPCAHMPSATLTERIVLLLAHGWKIGGGQLLHDANHGHGSRVITWTKFGADPNTKRPDNGRTVLHLLAERGVGRDAIRALVEAGADIDALDDSGLTPLDLARSASRQSAAQELERLGASSDTSD